MDHIDTLIVVMLENRSFDHMLGYLSLPPWNRTNVEGLSGDAAWLNKFANFHDGSSYNPFHLSRPSHPLPGDPPHDRTHIATQLGDPTTLPMTGFVDSYSEADPISNQPVAMGYFTGEDLPTTHFFAEQFAICDHWFSAIPTSTQPNRLMAMSGYSEISDNVTVLPEQHLVYDWLEERKIRWRVYHQGLPFFAMMPSWTPYLLMDYNFRDFSRFAHDIHHEGDDECPQVIFIEPRYTDAPHILPPTDDHAPTPITNGQDFLATIYSIVTSNPKRWNRTLLVITYDEHGGFFDHVSPPAIQTAASSGQYLTFPTLGVRVPGFAISPWIDAGQVFSGVLDHTSVLKFIAQRFGTGSYSPVVDARNVESLNAIPTRDAPREAIPLLPAAAAGTTPGTPIVNAIPQAFVAALDRLRTFDKDVTRLKFPTLFPHLWK